MVAGSARFDHAEPVKPNVLVEVATSLAFQPETLFVKVAPVAGGSGAGELLNRLLELGEKRLGGDALGGPGQFAQESDEVVFKAAEPFFVAHQLAECIERLSFFDGVVQEFERVVDVGAEAVPGGGVGFKAAKADAGQFVGKVLVDLKAVAQDVDLVIVGQTLESDLLAARLNGGDQRFEVGGDEDEINVGGRFFKGFEEGVGGFLAHAFHAVHHDHAHGAFERAKVQVLRNLSDLIDLDVVAVRFDESEVGVVAAGELAAVVASAAAGAGGAEHGAGDFGGEQAFADAAGTVETQTVVELVLFDHFGEHGFNARMSVNQIKHNGLGAWRARGGRA